MLVGAVRHRDGEGLREGLAAFVRCLDGDGVAGLGLEIRLVDEGEFTVGLIDREGGVIARSFDRHELEGEIEVCGAVIRGRQHTDDPGSCVFGNGGGRQTDVGRCRIGCRTINGTGIGETDAARAGECQFSPGGICNLIRQNLKQTKRVGACRVGKIGIDDAFDLAVDVQQRRRGIAQNIVDRGALRAAEAGKVIDSRGEGCLDRTQVGGITEIKRKAAAALGLQHRFQGGQDRCACIFGINARTRQHSGIGRQGRRDLDRSFLGQQRVIRVHTRGKGVEGQQIDSRRQSEDRFHGVNREVAPFEQRGQWRHHRCFNGRTKAQTREHGSRDRVDGLLAGYDDNRRIRHAGLKGINAVRSGRDMGLAGIELAIAVLVDENECIQKRAFDHAPGDRKCRAGCPILGQGDG
ncbi:MAG: Uncharacterised protein [Rhodospirillaceae bacterium]|nr:MAG: Uncharacterised protein [Rhodospirillaceae bacterium]